MTAQRLLEVCVDDAAGLRAAIEGGADRIELCSALALGGLTPSQGLMSLAARSPVPVYAMIRPRAGDFRFDLGEADIMIRDVEAVRDAGLAGVVLGASRSDDRLDLGLLERLCLAAEGLGRTLHRAFDLTGPRFDVAIDEAITLRFERILTSGGAPSVTEAHGTLARMIDHAAGRIGIMPGAGLAPTNLRELLVRVPSVREVHASCSRRRPARSAQAARLRFDSDAGRETSVETVRAMKAALREFEAGEIR